MDRLSREEYPTWRIVAVSLLAVLRLGVVILALLLGRDALLVEQCVQVLDPGISGL